MMVTKTIKYKDFNGEDREEEFLFNLSQAEMTEWETSVDGGMSNQLKRIAQAKKVPEIVAMVKELILKAYGEKSNDGRRFVKSKELSEAFYQTNAYDVLFMDLVSDPEKLGNFMSAVLPPPPEEAKA